MLRRPFTVTGVYRSHALAETGKPDVAAGSRSPHGLSGGAATNVSNIVLKAFVRAYKKPLDANIAAMVTATAMLLCISTSTISTLLSDVRLRKDAASLLGQSWMFLVFERSAVSAAPAPQYRRLIWRRARVFCWLTAATYPFPVRGKAMQGQRVGGKAVETVLHQRTSAPDRGAL
jgi:hypothetical protein